MDVLKKLTLRTMRLNPGRTVVTIIAVILSTALITAVADMAESFRASMVAYERAESGDFHYAFYDVSQEDRVYFEQNRNIAKLGHVQFAGYALLEESRNPEMPYLCVQALDENGAKATAVHLREGRLPREAGELAVSSRLISNGGVDVHVGDVLVLNMGLRQANDGSALNQKNPYMEGEEQFIPQEQVTCTVVGIVERSTYLESFSGPGYAAITWLEPDTVQGTVDIYATYTEKALKNRQQVTAGLMGISDALYQKYAEGLIETEEERQQVTAVASQVGCNTYLLKWQLLEFSYGTKRMLYAMAGIAIGVIILTSVFCIRTSFSISLTEKMRLYGMLSSVGVTRRQMRRLVYQEAAVLGLCGIPLGLLCGIGAMAALVRLAGGLLKQSTGISLVYVISVPAVLFSLVLSVIMILLSAGQSARMAARVSPISAIRGNTKQGIRRKDVRIPGLIGKLFGVGGVIACKNLRRARSKYRAAVAAIVISTALFIGMTTFVRIGFLLSNMHYGSSDWQLFISLGAGGDYQKETYQKALEIAGMDGIEQAEIRRLSYDIRVPDDQVPFDDQYVREIPWAKGGEQTFSYVSIGEEAFAAYCKELGLSAEQVGERAILMAGYEETLEEDGRTRYYEGIMYDYQPGDVITGVMSRQENKTVQVPIVLQTDRRPMCLEQYYGGAFLLVSDAWMDSHPDLIYPGISMYIRCEDPDGIEAAIDPDIANAISGITNQAEEYRKTRSAYLLVAIFLYGFIAVIALIGVTNIFNTITTSMELRAREFAMLRSVGMTSRELRRMLRLETLFYGGKALVMGITAGLLLSFAFTRALSERVEIAFQPPFSAVCMAAAAVFLLLAFLMRCAMKKISRRNLMDVIRDENT